MSQLRRDLQKRIRERMSITIRDTFTLYDIAELSDKDAVDDLTYELIHHFARLMAATDVKPGDIGIILEKLIARARGDAK